MNPTSIFSCRMIAVWFFGKIFTVPYKPNTMNRIVIRILYTTIFKIRISRLLSELVIVLKLYNKVFTVYILYNPHQSTTFVIFFFP